MALYLTGNTSNITIDSTSGITFPNATLQTVAAQTGPAFSAYASASQSLGAGATTLIVFDTKEFDTNTNYSTSTNRFTPTVAGYYQFGAAVTSVFGGGETALIFYKNGAQHKIVNDVQGAYLYTIAGSLLIYLNGSSDYVDVRMFTQTATTAVGGNRSYFQGFLARAA